VKKILSDIRDFEEKIGIFNASLVASIRELGEMREKAGGQSEVGAIDGLSYYLIASGEELNEEVTSVIHEYQNKYNGTTFRGDFDEKQEGVFVECDTQQQRGEYCAIYLSQMNSPSGLSWVFLCFDGRCV